MRILRSKKYKGYTCRGTQCFLTLLVLFSYAFLPLAKAVDYTSSNFTLRSPSITVLGGRSTTSTFTFFSATGQTAPGESTSSNFKYQAGFLYFDEAATTTTPGTGGGGGSVSGGAAPAASKIIFSGKAYPGATVYLLKDAELVKTAIADSDAHFTITLDKLYHVDYIFSLYAKDYEGRASRLIVFPTRLEEFKTTTVENVLIPPTIAKDKKEVKKGEILNIYGQSLPHAIISLAITSLNNIVSATATSDADGQYKYALNTSSLDFGDYKVTAQVSLGKVTSISAFTSFTVGAETIFEEKLTCPPVGDLNNDCAVNLVDFSILIYWFDKSGVPLKIDLNGDGIADLVDFSIMAYYWTG